MRPMYYGPAQRHEHGAGGFLFMIVMAIFWIALIAGIVLLVNKYALHHHPNQRADEDPINIAKARYAKGEITKDEFNQLKKDLS